MNTDEILKEGLFDIINTQIKANNPQETKLTFERLKGLGYCEEDVMQQIAQCLTIEIYSVLKDEKRFNKVRYNRNLNYLPAQPIEE